jgi:RNA polymerase sigma-70 factor (ECF subfamily)
MGEDARMVELKLVHGVGGAREAFERLVRPHFAMLHRVAFRFTGSLADAEDLVQETCIRAFREIERLSQLENPRAWLLCVMRRRYIDETRRYERRHASSFDDVAENLVFCERPGPAEAVESELMARRIETSWRKLGKDHRSLLVLHDVEGYSLSELEKMTGLRQGTIKSRLHRARVKLGKLLLAEGDTPGMTKTRWTKA